MVTHSTLRPLRDMPESLVGYLNLTSAVLALISGAVVLGMLKGTRAHIRAGRSYLACMIAVNISALAIYRITGEFGAFHALALISLGSVLAGFLVARYGGHGWIFGHAFIMLWSYVGIVAAAVSEAATHFLHWPSSVGVVGASVAVFVAGGLLVHTRGARAASRIAGIRNPSESDGVSQAAGD